MEDKFVKHENGEKVSVTHAEANSETSIFICHGFGGNKERQSDYLELVEEGFNVVTLSFRGNGKSDGEFIDQDLSTRISDLKKVVENFETEKTVLFGTSFGGKVAFHATEDLDADAVITKGPVTYKEIMDKFREVVENKGQFEYIPDKPIDERFFDDFESYKFEDLTSSIEIPLAIFHGCKDTTVHPKFSFKAAEKLETSIMLEKLEGEEHSFSEEGKDYMFSQMISWLHNNGF